jgi:hypothetical protein
MVPTIVISTLVDVGFPLRTKRRVSAGRGTAWTGKQTQGANGLTRVGCRQGHDVPAEMTRLTASGIRATHAMVRIQLVATSRL